MEPEEYDAINEARHPQNSRRHTIEGLVWSSNAVRNHGEIFINNIDYLLRQTSSSENDVTQNGSSGEMPEFLGRSLIRSYITASYYQSAIRRYNFWTLRHPEENFDHTVPGIEVSTYVRPPLLFDQVVPFGTNQANAPISVNSTLYQSNMNSRRIFGEQVRRTHYRDERFSVYINRDLTRNIPSVPFSNSSRGATAYHPNDLTSMRENGPYQNDLSRQDSYIDQTNVNLTEDCQKVETKCKRKKDIKVCQNHQECKSRRVNERACRLNKCHEITELENSSSAGQLASSVTQDSQGQNASTSTSLVNVPKSGELERSLPQNHEAKLPIRSTSMQTCNKEMTASSVNKPERNIKKEHESISKNSQNDGKKSLNPLLLNVINSDMQRAEPILIETCSRKDNNDECINSSENPKPNTENSTTSISYMSLSKDSTSNSRLVETNQDIGMAETYRKTQIENSPLSNFVSDSVNSAASNKKTDSLNASFEKSENTESLCDKANKLAITKLNSDKDENSGVVHNCLQASLAQIKENIPPDNSPN